MIFFFFLFCLYVFILYLHVDIKTDNEQRQRTAPQPVAGGGGGTAPSTPSRAIASSVPEYSLLFSFFLSFIYCLDNIDTIHYITFIHFTSILLCKFYSWILQLDVIMCELISIVTFIYQQ